jgi:hypothetical protein
LLFHFTALVVFESAFSTLEMDLSEWFWGYIGLINQDYTHRYFAPNPDPSAAVVVADLTFGDGRPPLELRLPDHSVRPRIRYVRQLALVWHLTREVRRDSAGERPMWAQPFARHLCRTNPGCVRVKLAWQEHLMPPLKAAYLAVAGGHGLELDSMDFLGPLQPLGEFSCQDQ